MRSVLWKSRRAYPLWVSVSRRFDGPLSGKMAFGIFLVTCMVWGVSEMIHNKLHECFVLQRNLWQRHGEVGEQQVHRGADWRRSVHMGMIVPTPTGKKF